MELNVDIKNIEIPLDQKKILKSNTKVLLYGAGQLGIKILRCLKKNKISPAIFIDKNEQKWGSKVEGLEVLSPRDAFKKYGKDYVVIVSIWAPHHSYKKTCNFLNEIGFEKVIPFQLVIWKYSKDILPHYQFSTPSYFVRNLNKIENVAKFFSHKKSLKEYVGHIKWRLTLDYNFLPKPSYFDQYFPKDILLINKNEVFVDCGAYIGDTIEQFIDYSNSNFSKIISFEPDYQNYKKSLLNINKYGSDIKKKIEIFNYAVGLKNINVKFNQSGATGSSISTEGSENIKCIKLDSFVFKDKPTFLKFDIEGYEMDALKGAKKIIKTLTPIIAVCVYHKPDDMWKIPLFINSINSEYKYFFRTHDEDGLELVLYAIPKNRVNKNG